MIEIKTEGSSTYLVLELKSESVLSMEINSLIIISEYNGRVNLCRGSLQEVYDRFIKVKIFERSELFKLNNSYLISSTNYQTYSLCLINLQNLILPLDDKNPIYKEQTKRQGELQSLLIYNKSSAEVGTNKGFNIMDIYKDDPINTKLKIIYENKLNKIQRDTVDIVLKLPSYYTIQGLPGTGKSTLILFIIEYLYTQNYRMLLVSHTNKAIDHLLLLLSDEIRNIYRYGSKSAIHPSLHQFLAPRESDLDKIPFSFPYPSIIATTCYSLYNPIILSQFYDICIVDEASQILEPHLYSCFMHSRSFLMVGDTYQLSPILLNTEVPEFPLSLMENLCRRFDANQTNLTNQYRMHRDIMYLSNQLIYNNLLVLGNEEIGKQQFKHTKTAELKGYRAKVLSLNEAVIFIDTDGISENLEIENKDGRSNRVESDVIVGLIKSFMDLGVDRDGIGIITPYKCQYTLIKECL